MLGHVSFQKFLLGTGFAFALPVPVPFVSRLHCYYAAIGLPWFFGSASGLPSALPTLELAALFCVPRDSRRDTGRSLPAQSGASESDHRFSADPDVTSGTSKGLPGCLGVLFKRATVEHPAGPSLARQFASENAAFERNETLSTDIRLFRDCNPAAHLFACLRFNRPVTATAARLATGLLARL